MTDIGKSNCSHCGMNRTPEGHDGCIGKLPGVMNACCGHGANGSGIYVQLLDSTTIRGKDATTLINILKKLQ